MMTGTAWVGVSELEQWDISEQQARLTLDGSHRSGCSKPKCKKSLSHVFHRGL